MVYIVKETFDVGFQHPVNFLCHDRFIDVSDYVMCTPSGTKPVWAVTEAFFIDFI